MFNDSREVSAIRRFAAPIALLRRFAATVKILLQRVGFAEKSALLGIGFSALFLYAFGQIADEVLEGETSEFDRIVLLAFRNVADVSDPVGPRWFEEMMRDFTALGGVGVLTLITLAITGFLFMTQKRHSAWMVLASVVGGVMLSNLLKWGFARPRPDLVPHGAIVYTQSFPSGHAMLSAVVYLTLGALLARTQARVRVKIYLLAIAALLTAIVGISRLYLGVHWPTDVLAGWTIGAAWALICWLAMLWLQREKKVEPENGVDAQTEST